MMPLWLMLAPLGKLSNHLEVQVATVEHEQQIVSAGDARRLLQQQQVAVESAQSMARRERARREKLEADLKAEEEAHRMREPYARAK